jgi:hypothetical protein
MFSSSLRRRPVDGQGPVSLWRDVWSSLRRFWRSRLEIVYGLAYCADIPGAIGSVVCVLPKDDSLGTAEDRGRRGCIFGSGVALRLDKRLESDDELEGL